MSVTSVVVRRFRAGALFDLHLSTLDGVKPRALLDKRTSATLLAAAAARPAPDRRAGCAPTDLHAEHFDHIAVTGDLTHLGLPQHFREAAAWLARLGKPDAITVVPGNHDAYVRTVAVTFAQWSAYMQGDGVGDISGPDDAFRAGAEARGGPDRVVDGAAFGAVPGHRASGEGQLRRLDRVLEQTAGSGFSASCCCIIRRRGNSALA